MTAPPKGIVITGAGTEIGKTHVAALLIRQLRARGIEAWPLKPVSSGYRPPPAPSDIATLLDAADLPTNIHHLDAHAPWRFAAPLSLPDAAALEHRHLDLDEILAYARLTLGGAKGFSVIEAAGGVMSPLTEDTTQLDLIADLGLPVLFVAGSYLGGISHALTGLAVLRQADIPVALTVVNAATPDAPAPEANARALQRFLPPGIPIHTLPYGVLDRKVGSEHDLSQYVLP